MEPFRASLGRQATKEPKAYKANLVRAHRLPQAAQRLTSGSCALRAGPGGQVYLMNKLNSRGLNSKYGLPDYN